jgi:formate hydrogenlyase subunit 6/NADH:ubiquinone oxidoreductase subunit I
MYITAVNFFRPSVCERYPRRDGRPDWHPRPGYRGDFALISAPERPGGLRCIACLQCQNVCPDGCIHITPTGKGKERYPQHFFIDAGLCMYCWMCVEVHHDPRLRDQHRPAGEADPDAGATAGAGPGI